MLSAELTVEFCKGLIFVSPQSDLILKLLDEFILGCKLRVYVC